MSPQWDPVHLESHMVVILLLLKDIPNQTDIIFVIISQSFRLSCLNKSQEKNCLIWSIVVVIDE